MLSETDRETLAQPGFVMSTERSGSNLLRLILNAHPDVSAPHPFETSFPDEGILNNALTGPGRNRIIRDILVWKRHSHHPFNRPLGISAVLDRLDSGPPLDESLLALQRALYGEYTAQAGTSLWISKDPGVFEYADRAIDHYSPMPRFVYLVRDPRDVALSFKRSDVAGIHHPYYAAQRWQQEQLTGINLLETVG
mgnify:CR=1 FL=1